MLAISDKSNPPPFKKGASLRVDCRSLFSEEQSRTETLSPTENGLWRRDQFFERACKSTQDVRLHGAPLPLVWVLVSDNVIPDYAVPFSEAYDGPQFIARAFLEDHYCIGRAGTGLPFGARITYAGRQLTVKRYEVLCFATEMRWSITQECEYIQQSSFIVSNTLGLSQNSLHASRTEIAASTLLDSDLLRVIPDNGRYYDMSMERSSGRSTGNRRCSSPLSPISRHVMEEICSSDPQFARRAPMSLLSAHQEDDVASESFRTESASQAMQKRSCSHEGSQTLRSPARLSPTLFPEVGRLAKGNNKSSAVAQSHRGTLTDPTINEEGSTSCEQSQSRLQTCPLSATQPTRLTGSLHIEATLEQENDGGRTHDVPVATSPRINRCLSPITHFSLPEPFNGSADSTVVVTSPRKQARSIGRIIGRSNQDDEGEARSGRLTHAKASSAPRISSPLTGVHQSSGWSLSAAGYRHSSRHAECTDDDSSFSESDTGSLYRSTHTTPASRLAQQNRTGRALDTTAQTWVGSGSHEIKPHARPAPRDSSVQMLPTRATGRSIGQSLVNVEEEVDVCGVASTTSGVKHNLTTQHSGPGAQGRSNSVITELRPSLVAKSSLESSTRSPYRSKGDKLAHIQPRNPSVPVPLIIVSPTINRRELPESSRDQITPLKVSVDARRGRFSSNAPPSGERVSSLSVTGATSSMLGAAALVAAVASSCADDTSIVSPLLIADTHEDDRATTRSSGNARLSSTTVVQDKFKDQDQCLSDTTRKLGPTLIATARLGSQTRVERAELGKHVSEEIRLDVSVEDSSALEKKGLGVWPTTPTGPQLPGRKPQAARYIVERDDVGERRHGHVPAQGAFVQEMERTVIQSSHDDMVQIQPSDTDVVLSDASVSKSASPEISHRAKGASGPYDDTQVTDVVVTRASFHSQADTEAKTTDPSSMDDHTSYRKPGKDTKSSVEASSKTTMASPAYATAPVQLRDAGYLPGGREHEPFRQADAVDVNSGWGEAMRTTAPSACHEYQVPLSEYLGIEDDADGTPVTSRTHTENRLKQSLETKPHHDAVEDSKGTRVTHKLEEQGTVPRVVTNKDSTKSTTSKKDDDPVVSTVLAAVCVAAVALEAVAGSKHKEHSKVKPDRRDKVTHDRDALVVTESARTIKDDQTSTIEKNIAVDLTLQRGAVAESSVPTGAEALTQTEIPQSSEQRSRHDTSEDQMEHVLDSRTSITAVDVRTGESIAPAGHPVVVQDAVSTPRVPSAEERTIDDISFNQRTQEQVSGGTVQTSGRIQMEIDIDEQTTHAAQLGATESRERRAETLVEFDGDLNRHASFGANSVVGRTNDKLAECSTRSEEQSMVIQECKTIASECEVERSLARPNSNPTLSQASTVVVVSPQACVNVQQTVASVTVASSDTAQSTASTSENHPEQRTESVAQCSEVDTRLLSLEENAVVLSSESLETSTETRSTERSDRVTADERVLDRVSGAYKSSATTIDDVTIAQKSATSVRSGYVDQSTTPRRTATVDSLEKRINPDRIRATTAYNVVDVEVDRTVVGRPTTMETPFSELNEVQKDANELLGDTSAPPLRIQTSSNVACSTQGSVVRKDTSLKASGECVTGNMSTQRSEKQVEAGHVDFLADAQDVDVIETREQTTYITSSREASVGGFGQSIDKTSRALVRSEDQTPLDEVSRQDEVTEVMASVTIGSIALAEQHAEPSKVAVLTGNASVSSHDSNALFEDDSAHAEISYQMAGAVTSTCTDYQSGQPSGIETRDVVAKEVVMDDEQRSDHFEGVARVVRAENTYVSEDGDLAGHTPSASPSTSPARSEAFSLMVKGEDRMSGSAAQATGHAFRLGFQLGASTDEATPVDHDALRTETCEAREESERIQVVQLSQGQSVGQSTFNHQRDAMIDTSNAVSPRQASLLVPLTGSPRRATSDKAFAQINSHELVTEDVEFKEEHASEFSAHLDNSPLFPVERSGPVTYGAVDLDLPLAYSPASSPSASPLTPTAGTEPSVGKRADRDVESRHSDGRELAFSSLAQEARTQRVCTQTASNMNSDYEWQVNTWIPDGKEPPPSYEDAISDYHKSPMLSSDDALPEDDHQSLGQYAQFYGDDKSSIAHAASNEFRRQPEEGTSALEQRSAFQAIRATNDRGVDESKRGP
ncbi:hypothetical protein JVT61DRAFT_9177 [Boletus reticuloceps]|uniref:Uncharacterized protein n=1 Tax=Boletus reticuloceps TaxID=495285 RepID=A0A8I2YGX0_9AGAM|nr:hypothetical protein JVT61DRAFT_9177 [Boletus reticuloceps]